MSTPPFVAWSIRHQCDLREVARDDSPMSVERALRPARAWGEAVAENRISNDLCLARAVPHQPTLGFPIGETLAVYGGASHILKTCRNCPANLEGHISLAGTAHRRNTADSDDQIASPLENSTSANSTSEREEPVVAGCFGEAVIPEPGSAAWVEFEQQARKVGEEAFRHFPPTTPSWYGVFLVPAWESQHLSSVASFLLALERAPRALDSHKNQTHDSWDWERGIRRLRSAVDLALQHEFVVDLTLIPAGRRQGRSWHLASHCSNCKSSMEPTQRHCRVCGKNGLPYPGSKRCARGNRPFMPLHVFLGPDEINAIECEAAATEPLHHVSRREPS